MDSPEHARHADLEFNAPLSSARARELAASLGPLTAASIVDLGCGWAELLLRVLADEPTARGVGIDRDPVAIARARSRAELRGLRDRVRLECADATSWSDHADALIVIGSSHAWGGTRAALDALHRRQRRGGRLLFGECIWEQPPTPEALAALAVEPDEFRPRAGLEALVRDCGYTILDSSIATLDEWEDFETRYCAGRERWLAQHPDAADAAAVRAEIDEHRDGWLHGYRGILGFAYLTLTAGSP